jgi:hypothetical protein
MELTAEQKQQLACEECGCNVLNCDCEIDEQFDAALELWRLYGAAADSFVPTAQPASVPEARWVAAGGAHKGLWLDKPPCPEAAKEYGIEWVKLPATGIPESAQRIMDLGRTQPTPAPRVVDPRADGIGRAVDRLSQHEPRLGCHAWRP